MNTYTGGASGNKQGGDSNEKENTGEDLFLSGGFDSFGGAPEPMNTGMGTMDGGTDPMGAGLGQLGSIDYNGGYGSVDRTERTNLWANQKINLNLWEQLFNSFIPFKYDRYKGLSEGAAKDFVKFFIKTYLLAGYLFIFIMLFQFPGVKEYLKNGNISILLVVIILGVSYAVSAFLGPYLFRLQALIYRLIFGNLLAAIEKKNITSTNMYLVSIYACIPWMVIRLLYGIGLLFILLFMPVLPLLPPAWLLSALELVVPIIIMAIAIPKME